MINAVDWALQKIGYKQVWHVMWRVRVTDSHFLLADGSYDISPRMNASVITKLRERLAKDAEGQVGREVLAADINITCLVRL